MNTQKNNTGRRTAIQQMLLATAGLSMFSLPSFATKETIDAEGGKKLLPFFLPPIEPLQPGPGGIDIRTWFRSTRPIHSSVVWSLQWLQKNGSRAALS